ncbi:hypothetical protein QJQ45_028622 [Haematococcus lacustris]|nr:hypothetical protein QJQ45_028622 [Haematococcus lacustris]
MLNKQMPEYIKHHRLAHHQLQVFREHREAIKSGKDGKVVISCDWSEKLTVERSVEIMSEHWHAQQIGILVACAYFKNKEGAYYEQTVYVMTDGKEQLAAITQAAVNQVPSPAPSPPSPAPPPPSLVLPLPSMPSPAPPPPSPAPPHPLPALPHPIPALTHPIQALPHPIQAPCPLPCPLPRPLPCPGLPCPALPCPALPCPALPCPALPCPALHKKLPHLQVVAQRVLSIPATSTATERLFSAFKFIWSDRRSRLLLGRMWIMSYVFFNTRVMTRKEHHASAEAQEEWESYMAAQSARHANGPAVRDGPFKCCLTTPTTRDAEFSAAVHFTHGAQFSQHHLTQPPHPHESPPSQCWQLA